jgi:hypothetical protein
MIHLDGKRAISRSAVPRKVIPIEGFWQIEGFWPCDPRPSQRMAMGGLLRIPRLTAKPLAGRR